MLTGFRMSESNVITQAVRQADTSQVKLVHTAEQKGMSYGVIGANATPGDGFDDASLLIKSDDLSENLQLAPRDRASWIGCAPPITQFEEGPIANDPFSDTSTFGYLATYHGKVYIGPNKTGNSANRFDPDGSNPTNVYFEFVKDTTGTRQSENTAATRDGAIAVPPYVTIGHGGIAPCSQNNANLATGCGPDNEDGRGLFVNGSITAGTTTEYLFITGGRSSGNNDYIYWTSDTDNTLNFNYVDMYATNFDGSTEIIGNKGTESIVIFNNRVYWMEPGDNLYRPYFTRIRDITVAESVPGTSSDWLRARYLPGIGQYASKSNRADRIGGTLYEFNGKLYLANNGSVKNTTDTSWDNVRPGCNATTNGSNNKKCINDGGIVRSNNTNPAACTTGGTCSDWTDITPTGTDYVNYFSKILAKLADAIPADRPIPGLIKYKQNLYMIRNACTKNMIDTTNTPGTDDKSCTDSGGYEVWQLWKCVPATVGGDCNAANWSLITQRDLSTGTNTDMRNKNNQYATLLVANGDYLYVGFDNGTNGVQLWRTNVGVEATGTPTPAGPSDFTQIGGNGLGYPADYTAMYSGISIQGSDGYYIYVSAGNSSGPVAVFRQKNN
jgi:hypothetical protein